MKHTSIYKVMSLALLASVASCGLQIRDNPFTTNNPVVQQPEELYTVSGTATGIKYEAVDTPTNYTDNMPEGIVLTLNGVELSVTANGEFKFANKLKSGDDYEVSIVDNGIVIPSNDGLNPPIYLNCDLYNTTGTIIDHDIVDVKVECFLGDSPYKDPGEL